jgi:hypothetical protein
VRMSSATSSLIERNALSASIGPSLRGFSSLRADRKK